MAKSAKTSTNATCGTHTTSIQEIHTDILLSHIFVRLQAKCVGRCKSICKQWLALLSTRKFTTTYCRYFQTNYNQKIIVLKPWHTTVYPLTFAYQNHISPTVVPLPFEANPRDVTILTTLNGLICLCFQNTGKFVIWNPLTCAYTTLPTTATRGIFNKQSDTVGMYLNDSHEYTVLHVKRDSRQTKLYKYSSELGVWKTVGKLNEVKLGTNDCIWKTGTFNNGVLYFVLRATYYRRRPLLLAFDTHHAKFSNITLPKVLTKPMDVHSLVMDNHLHIFLTRGRSPFWTVDLWKMTCNGWTKVWVFPPIRPILLGFKITYISTTGKFLVVSYDGSTNEIDITKNGEDSYYPLVYYQGLQAIVYNETIATP